MAGIDARTCAWCGGLFIPTHWRSKYCCEECRIEGRQEAVRKANQKNNAKVKKQANKKKCLICKKVFSTPRSDIVTCSPYCQKVRTDELQKEYRKIRREELKKKKACKPLTLAEFDRKAKEMGMSYGHYQLYLRTQGKEQKNVV